MSQITLSLCVETFPDYIMI